MYIILYRRMCVTRTTTLGGGEEEKTKEKPTIVNNNRRRVFIILKLSRMRMSLDRQQRVYFAVFILREVLLSIIIFLR